MIVDEYLFFTIWHYLRVIVTLLLIALGILIAKRQENQKIVLPMIFLIVLIVILIATITLVALDKYTNRVVFDYPAYFHNVTDFASATAH